LEWPLNGIAFSRGTCAARRRADFPPRPVFWERVGVRVFLLSSLALFLSACQQPQPPGYYGATSSLEEVISKINANNRQLPTLWSRLDFSGTIIDDKQVPHKVDASGVLLYRQPHEMLIRCSKEFVGPVFELGTTEQNYWLKIPLREMDTLWWGRMINADKPCSSAVPVRPDLILDVLAVGTTDENFSREPYPVMRFNNDLDVYMIDSIVKHPDRYVVQKEVWYDRQTLLPQTVLLLDATGRTVLRAHLSEFTTPAASNARIAGRYKLLFPDTGSTMEFALSQPALNKNGIPAPGGIHMPDLQNPGVGTVIQVDKNCDTTRPTP